MAISAFLSPNPLPPSSTSRKSSESAAASDSLFLFLKSSQTFRILASRAGAFGVDLAGAFWISCAVATARNNEHATAVRISFMFSPEVNRMRRYHSEHGKVKIHTLSRKAREGRGTLMTTAGLRPTE